jgi:hypothetical protein
VLLLIMQLVDDDDGCGRRGGSVRLRRGVCVARTPVEFLNDCTEWVIVHSYQ